jgi:hypothetical protein
VPSDLDQNQATELLTELVRLSDEHSILCRTGTLATCGPTALKLLRAHRKAEQFLDAVGIKWRYEESSSAPLVHWSAFSDGEPACGAPKISWDDRNRAAVSPDIKRSNCEGCQVFYLTHIRPGESQNRGDNG